MEVGEETTKVLTKRRENVFLLGHDGNHWDQSGVVHLLVGRGTTFCLKTSEYLFLDTISQCMLQWSIDAPVKKLFYPLSGSCQVFSSVFSVCSRNSVLSVPLLPA